MQIKKQRYPQTQRRCSLIQPLATGRLCYTGPQIGRLARACCSAGAVECPTALFQMLRSATHLLLPLPLRSLPLLLLLLLQLLLLLLLLQRSEEATVAGRRGRLGRHAPKAE